MLINPWFSQSQILRTRATSWEREWRWTVPLSLRLCGHKGIWCTRLSGLVCKCYIGVEELVEKCEKEVNEVSVNADTEFSPISWRQWYFQMRPKAVRCAIKRCQIAWQYKSCGLKEKHRGCLLRFAKNDCDNIEMETSSLTLYLPQLSDERHRGWL